MKRLPQVTVPFVVKELGITASTARNVLNQMVNGEVLKEISDKKRDKVYVYNNYLKTLEEGAEPLE